MIRFVTRASVGAVAAIGIIAGTSHGSQAASDMANAIANNVVAIAISKTVDLDFASIVANGSADTVVVSPAGARTCSGTLTCASTVAAASLTVGATLQFGASQATGSYTAPP